MSAALALLPIGTACVGVRVVTVCCGGHRPAHGEASTCSCCTDCVTNAGGRAEVPAERVRADRAATAARLARLRATVRRAVHVVIHDAVDAHVRPLADATRHAVAIPPQQARPALPELDEICARYELVDRLKVGFTGMVPT
ncbi:hypothetical protein [Actinosynnema sp. NPDC023587]|uniref:hypothetical protein n=1 Tax=Actinosynnema sp. NPDC023587 TaxID=3154695 RepID=UPI00340DC791